MFWSTAEEEKMDRVGDVTTTVDTRKLDFVAVVFWRRWFLVATRTMKEGEHVVTDF